MAIIGLGAWGGACLWRIARRGHRVIGLDRFSPPHAQGSSHGRLRIILPGMPRVVARGAYKEIAGWSRDLWLETERLSRESLLLTTGAISIGRPDSAVVVDTKSSHEAMAVPYDVLEPSDINRLFVGLRARPGDIGVWDQHTFVVRVEEAIAAQLVLASKFGADIHTDEPVKTWSTSPSRVKVDTSRNSYDASHLVIAAGGWTDDLLDGLLGMISERQVMAWYVAQATGGSYIPGRCPVFLLETRPPYEFLYGAPSVDSSGVRLSLHYGGLRGHPDTIDRRVSRDDLSAIADALDGRFIGLQDRPTSSSVCFYPYTLDRVFCIGPHPSSSRIIIATGGSGHGFRFAQAVGELVADYIDGRQSLDLQEFYPSRFLSDRTL